LGVEALVAEASGFGPADGRTALDTVEVALVVSAVFGGDGCSVSVAVCGDVVGSVAFTSSVGAPCGESSARAAFVT
jgi:hypothetical protein